MLRSRGAEDDPGTRLDFTDLVFALMRGAKIDFRGPFATPIAPLPGRGEKL